MTARYVHRTVLTCASGKLIVANARRSDTMTCRRVCGAYPKRPMAGCRAATPDLWGRDTVAAIMLPSPALCDAICDGTSTVSSLDLTTPITQRNWQLPQQTAAVR